MKSNMSPIGLVSLLLFKSLHIQGVSTHESKEKLVILTSNNLFPCLRQKSFVHGHHNDVFTRKILYNFIYKWDLHKFSFR